MFVTRRLSQEVQKPAAEPGKPAEAVRWPWLLADRGILGVVATVTVIGVAATVAMLLIAAGVADAADRAGLRIEAIKYGLGFFAAAGAAAALLLGVRRQRLSEHSHELELRKQTHTETDARERRVNELYTKAVEQLGSADAAVRLGGLYALERVAQQNPDQRQTVVNVLCAYLRMPYTLPGTPAADAGGGRDPRQEREVRLTAQKVISSHLQPRATAAGNAPSFWADIDLNLVGAVLIDWRFAGRLVNNAQFKDAIFSGDTDFERATFTGQAGFERAKFTGDAGFERTTFRGEAQFDGAQFDEKVAFGGATFGGDARFAKTFFQGAVQFGDVTFARSPALEDARVEMRSRHGDVWPAGWRLVPDRAGARLTRASG